MEAKGHTCVYILIAADHIKIGISANLPDRLLHLQMASPIKIEVAHHRLFPTRDSARLVERSLHAKFAAARSWGEWFGMPVADAIEALNAASEVEVPVAIPTGPRQLAFSIRRRPAQPAPPARQEIANDGPTFEEFEAMSDEDWCENMRACVVALDFTLSSDECQTEMARIRNDLRQRYPQYYEPRAA